MEIAFNGHKPGCSISPCLCKDKTTMDLAKDSARASVKFSNQGNANLARYYAMQALNLAKK